MSLVKFNDHIRKLKLKTLHFVMVPLLICRKIQLKKIIERSRENIAEVIKILPDDVNRELLPEGKSK